MRHVREAVGIFSLQTGSGTGLHSVPAEGAGGFADPSGGVSEGAEWDHLPAARRRGTGEDVRHKPAGDGHEPCPGVRAASRRQSWDV